MKAINNNTETAGESIYKTRYAERKKYFQSENNYMADIISGGLITEWKEIVIDSYASDYEINNIGQVRNKKKPEILLAICDNGRGYKFSHIRINKKSKCFLIHRLVATAFIPNTENKDFINHKNCLKYDNRVENLEWVTKSENMQHAIKNGLTTHHSPAKTLHIQRLADMKRGTKKNK